MNWKLEKKPIINSLEFIVSSTYCIKYWAVLQITFETKQHFSGFERGLVHCWAFVSLVVFWVFFFFKVCNNYPILLPILSLLVFIFIQSTKNPRILSTSNSHRLQHNLNIALWTCRFAALFVFVVYFPPSILLNRSLKNIKHLEIKIISITNIAYD